MGLVAVSPRLTRVPSESYVPTLPPSVTSVPTDPINQFWAVGGFCTMKLSAFEFQTTELAPAQP